MPEEAEGRRCRSWPHYATLPILNQADSNQIVYEAVLELSSLLSCLVVRYDAASETVALNETKVSDSPAFTPILPRRRSHEQSCREQTLDRRQNCPGHCQRHVSSLKKTRADIYCPACVLLMAYLASLVENRLMGNLTCNWTANADCLTFSQFWLP